MTKERLMGLSRWYAMALAFSGPLIAASAGAAPTTPASGTLDAGFGKGGRVITTVGMPASGALAVLVQPDGKIVAAGFTSKRGGGFALVRYKRNGSLDPTFGSDGRVTTRLGSHPSYAQALARQHDGKIIAAGDGSGSIALARYSRSGKLDPRFGTGGIVQTKLSDSETESVGAYDVVLQPNGKIIAIGGRSSSEGATLHEAFALVRYQADGTLDSSFGVGGKVTTPTEGFASAVVLQPDGKIVVAGSSARDARSFRAFTVARYAKDGSLDPTFGSGGIAKTSVGSLDGARAVMVQRSGKIVVVGSTGRKRSVFALVRYNRNGTLDASFGSHGIVKSGVRAAATAAALQRDGKVVVVGWATWFSSVTRSTRWDFALARFGLSGTLDRSFGNGGRITTSFRSAAPKTSHTREDTAEAVAIQPNGKIVAAGEGAVHHGASWGTTRYKFELARYMGR